MAASKKTSALQKPKSKAYDDSGTHVWLVMMKAYRTLEKHALRSFANAEVGLSDFGTLEVLLHKGPLPVNEIGRRIHLTSGSITIAVDRLEQRGLVERSSDPNDRRARVVSLTNEGRSLIVEVFRAHKAAMDNAAQGLSKTERAALARLLKKLGLSAEQRLSEDTSPERNLRS